jgi:hypothetical protein
MVCLTVAWPDRGMVCLTVALAWREMRKASVTNVNHSTLHQGK